MSQNEKHPSHPVRNFFYLLWSLVNTLAFVGLFVVITLPVPYKPVVNFVLLVVLLLAVVFGIIRPLFKLKRK